MTPQTSVIYAAPLRAGAREQVSALLARMNVQPGVVDPMNDTLRFKKVERLHFARMLTVNDPGAQDRAVYGLPVSGLPDYFVLLAEIDGDEPSFRKALASAAGSGFAEIVAQCEGKETADVFSWLSGARVAANASYTNWLGRTVQQVREEEQLRQELTAYMLANAGKLRPLTPAAVRAELLQHVRDLQRRGLLTLSPAKRTPVGWWVDNIANLVLVPVLLILLAPVLILLSPWLLWQIRSWERNDPAVAPPVDATHADELTDMENHDVTNQFDVFGSVKPGRLRYWLVRLFLLVTDYAARHLYHRGHLARVSTIHFARWVMFDGGQRMLFSSIYDGSLESYMDDFINKVGFGLNITFSNGIGYPRTRWLLLDGCKDEQVFKRVLRRHQLPTEVWYSANPGLTAANRHRNSLIRAGVESGDMSDAETREWLALL